MLSEIKIQQTGRLDTAEKKIITFENMTLEIIKSKAHSNKMLRKIPRE